MASEYLKWKYRDVKPDGPPPPRSRKEKIANWFYYYKWWIVAWAVLLYILVSIVCSALGIGQVKPDYRFAYVGSRELPEEFAASLEAQLATLGSDVNGDGEVTVELRRYVTGYDGDLETAMYYNYAADVTLVADISAGESYFFLAENPAELQKNYQIFAMPDGSAPGEDDESVEGKVIRWSDCPALAGLDIDQERLENLWVGRRCFYGEASHESDDALWSVITKGAETK